WIQSRWLSSVASAASWRWSRVGWLPMQAPSCGVVGVGAGSAWRRHAPIPRIRSGRPPGRRRAWPSPPLLGALAVRPSRRRGVGAFGAGGLSWAAGVGQADLAAGGQGAVGLPRFLGDQPTALGCCKERVVDLVVVEGPGGD